MTTPFEDDLYALSTTSFDDSYGPNLQTIKNNKIDKNITLPDDFPENKNLDIKAIIWHNNTLYIAGNVGVSSTVSGVSSLFNTAQSVSDSKPYVGYFDGGSFKSIDTNINEGGILTMTTHNNTLYIGGNIGDSDDDQKPYLAYLEGESFIEINININNRVISTMTTHNNTLYIGYESGNFINDNPKPYVAYLEDDGSFKEIDTNITNGGILSMTTHNNTLYIGGYNGVLFSDTYPKPYVEYLKNGSFIEIDTNFNEGLITTMTTHNNILYIGPEMNHIYKLQNR